MSRSVASGTEPMAPSVVGEFTAMRWSVAGVAHSPPM